MVGNFKGIGKVYSQVFIDSYSRVADAKLYTDKTAITAADMFNDRVLPWYESQGIPILRILTDRGSEYKGNIEHHAFELFLSIEGIEILQLRHILPKQMECVSVLICRSQDLILQTL